MSRRPPPGNPFRALGLDAAAGLTDDDVRAAWRRVASATHPDREDGGDPAAFAEAAAAYTALRTRFGRGEALADLAGPGPGGPGLSDMSGPGQSGPGLARAGLLAPHYAAWRLLRRVRRGRPGRLALRACAAVAASVAAIAAAGLHPAGPALVAGAVTWLLLTARRDLGPPG